MRFSNIDMENLFGLAILIAGFIVMFMLGTCARTMYSNERAFELACAKAGGLTTKGLVGSSKNLQCIARIDTISIK